MSDWVVEIFDFLTRNGVSNDETSSFTFADYTKGEKEILEPLLNRVGVTVDKWETSESDSFGPLSRSCKGVIKVGDEYHSFTGWYG